MGSGKSTVGLLLAARLERPFIDVDQRIEEEAHATISELWSGHGEAAFRATETQMLRQIAAGGGEIVVGVGGGAPAHGDNMALLLGAGVVVCLTASVDDLLQRLGSAPNRPLLAGHPDKRSQVEQLLAARARFYAQANLTVDTSGRAPSQVVSEIMTRLGLAT
jgi:shikimate kinase